MVSVAFSELIVFRCGVEFDWSSVVSGVRIVLDYSSSWTVRCWTLVVDIVGLFFDPRQVFVGSSLDRLVDFLCRCLIMLQRHVVLRQVVIIIT